MTEWRKRLSDIGREFEDAMKDERVRYEEKSKQYQRVIEKQQEKLDRFEDKLKRTRENYEAEIEEYKTQIANFKREMGKMNSESGQRKALKSLTYQLIATRFELAETRETLKRRSEKGKENGEDNNHNNNIVEESKKNNVEKEPNAPLYSKEMLYYAAEKGLRGLVQKILSPQQNYPDKLSVPLGNAMSKACVGGNVDVVKHLLQYGASVNAKMTEEEDELCPLHFACRYGRAEVVKMLIDEGAEIDSIDSTGRTPLFHAAETNHSECVELLLFAGCDISVQDLGGSVVQSVSGDGALSTLRDHKMLFWNCCTRGNRVYNQSHHEEALRLFKEALRLTNEHKLQVGSKDKATIHYNCARAAIRMHRHLLAVEHCTFAIDLDSSFFKAWKLRGESRHKLHDFKDAVSDFEQALKLEPVDNKVFAMLEESRRARDMDHYTLFGVPVSATVCVLHSLSMLEREAREHHPLFLSYIHTHTHTHTYIHTYSFVTLAHDSLKTYQVPEIKKRYRKLCLKWHPDKNRKTKDDMHRAANMFRRIQDAYKILTEPCQRILYDMAHNKKSDVSTKQNEKPVRRASSSSSSSSSEKTKKKYSYEDDFRNAEDDFEDDDFDELDESLDYPLVEEDDMGDDLFGEPFGLDDPFDDVYDDDDDDFTSRPETSRPSSGSGKKDRMWKLFEEYERAYSPRTDAPKA
jgi:curved DNA-binding protein CbpA/tetratricopeptide (TPR) repeat protein